MAMRKGTQNVTKHQLEPPFREKDLLTVNAFIRYCDDYGVRTDGANWSTSRRRGCCFRPCVRAEVLM